MSASSIEWGSIAEWVSGLGAFGAVVTALYLSRADQRISLKGYCGLRNIAGPGVPAKEYLVLSVTNVGRRSTVLNNIGMKTGLLRKKNAVIAAFKDAYSDGIPVEIADGEVRRWSIPMENHRKWVKDLTKSFVTTRWEAKRLRFYVWTTHGTSKKIKPERALVDAIMQQLEANNA